MLTWVVIITLAIVHLLSIRRAPDRIFYLSKPAPILLMALTLWMSPQSSTLTYLFIGGLLLSALGDVFLMLPKDRFIAGLSAFLGAHLCYSLGFWSLVDGDMVWWLPAVLFSAGIMLILLLLPDLKSMVVPVTVYMLVIVQMAWAAGEVYLTGSHPAGGIAFTGALLFLVSDLVLAVNRFRNQSQRKQYLIMSSYYLAQGLITYSVLSL